jgi:hypothetical protein
LGSGIGRKIGRKLCTGYFTNRTAERFLDYAHEIAFGCDKPHETGVRAGTHRLQRGLLNTLNTVSVDARSSGSGDHRRCLRF